MKPSHTFIFLETSGSKIKHGVRVRQLIRIDKCSFKEMGEKISTPIFTERGKTQEGTKLLFSIKTHCLLLLGITPAQGNYELKDGILLIIGFFFLTGQLVRCSVLL